MGYRKNALSSLSLNSSGSPKKFNPKLLIWESSQEDPDGFKTPSSRQPKIEIGKMKEFSEYWTNQINLTGRIDPDLYSKSSNVSNVGFKHFRKLKMLWIKQNKSL